MHTLANDSVWTHQNFGQYYAQTMNHDVTVVYDPSGDPIYASRNARSVIPASEAAFSAAIAPFIRDVRAEAHIRRPSNDFERALGLSSVVTRQGIVSVSDTPYLVSVSSIVPEDASYDNPGRRDPVVASGYRVSHFVADLATELDLESPQLVTAHYDGPKIALKGPDGGLVAVVGWIARDEGSAQLSGAAPVLIATVLSLLMALICGGLRVSWLIRAFEENERALGHAVNESKAAYAAKSQFLANMSHELRTPLNGIIAMTELLHPRQTDSAARQMTQTIIASGRMLEHVVNDILDASKMEADQMSLEVAPFDAVSTIQEIAHLHSAAAAAKSVALVVDIRTSATGVYMGDKTRVGQLVSNLLSNAVKFTEAGQITITARNTCRGLCISVSDSGIGFDREVASRLFEKFVQADVSVSRRYGGSGLGLCISQSLARLMGGSVKARSVPGRGSIFFAHLPLLKECQHTTSTAPATEEPVATLDDRTLSILLADDHEVNRRVVAMILQPFNIDLTIVQNGKDALEAAVIRPFDLILMDVQMPIMDGLTATSHIRAFERSSGRDPTPIISLTANAVPDDVKKSLEAGSNIHLAKPVRPDALIEAIQSLVATSDDETPLAA